MQILVSPAFSVESELLLDDSHLVRVHGEIDLHAAPLLDRALTGILRTGAARIVVDLSEVPFLDTSGVDVLLAAAWQLAPARVVLVAPEPQPRRVLALTRADRVLCVLERT